MEPVKFAVLSLLVLLTLAASLLVAMALYFFIVSVFGNVSVAILCCYVYILFMGGSTIYSVYRATNVKKGGKS